MKKQFLFDLRVTFFYFSGRKTRITVGKAKEKINGWIDRFNAWRTTHMTDRRFMLILSIPTGFLAGAAAVIIKKLAHGIRDLVITAQFQYSFLLYFICPAIGILLTILGSSIVLSVAEVSLLGAVVGLIGVIVVFVNGDEKNAS